MANIELPISKDAKTKAPADKKKLAADHEKAAEHLKKAAVSHESAARHLEAGDEAKANAANIEALKHYFNAGEYQREDTPRNKTK